ncbi:ImmA/IrrE family metallo-endopeptidase [Oligoflexus tunisiensis]|uniref:ImmA/IrrE family metallo-endopeptidase n=1 Tax=Oligoflexus tunisiensis TaxID=708132 RepID=UPI00114D2EBF|nr:ImmA/IrrE family metallo-endopeptidase [Oligoflexus tunisiensis]
MLALFPEILHTVNSGDLETLACLVRKYFADKHIYSPRLRVEPLLINAGLELSRDDIGEAARLFAADHRGAWHASLILSPSLRDPGEVNFTLAHLFGHFLCEFQPLMARGELKTHEVRERSGALGRFLKRPFSTPEEMQADAFASALLMPRGMVKKAYTTLGTVADTAAFFNVRPELMEQRLAQLELILTKTEPAPAPAPAPLTKPAPTPQQNSVVKAQKAVAASHYRREGESTTKPEAPKSSEGLSRLRAIARKIDKSVGP